MFHCIMIQKLLPFISNLKHFKYQKVDFFAKFRTYVLALTATKEGENFYERKISKYCYSVF